MTSAAVTLLGFAGIVAAAVLVELAARRSGRIARFGDFVGVVLARRWARGVVLAAWLWLGWHVFVRVHWR